VTRVRGHDDVLDVCAEGAVDDRTGEADESVADPRTDGRACLEDLSERGTGAVGPHHSSAVYRSRTRLGSIGRSA
jgi:hypothetical protein